MILITAATPWESGPLSGRLAGPEVRVLETGMGPDAAQNALAALPCRDIELVVSAGFAGALQPGIRSGEVVADPFAAPLELLEAARRAAAGARIELHLGRIVSVNRVLSDPEEKRELGLNRRAAAVDMESSAVRAWAKERGAEFIALRAVLDDLETRLPRAVPASSLASDLARYAAAHWRETPLLLKLAWLQRRGMSRLGAFLERFLAEAREKEAA